MAFSYTPKKTAPPETRWFGGGRHRRKALSRGKQGDRPMDIQVVLGVTPANRPARPLSAKTDLKETCGPRTLTMQYPPHHTQCAKFSLSTASLLEKTSGESMCRDGRWLNDEDLELKELHVHCAMCSHESGYMLNDHGLRNCMCRHDMWFNAEGSVTVQGAPRTIK